MKTVELIPFILLELNDSDKYGFELTKNIETKSNGKIIIKQPTLYTLLKKLEKSKFIASYWQDSDIGGKRHYYKLTENGKLQVSTLPSYKELLIKLFEDNEEFANIVTEEVSTEKQRVSIMDELLNSSNSQPVESIIPSSEVFSNENIDNATELDFNIFNTQILKDETKSSEEQFAENVDVKKFTERIDSTPIKLNKQSTDNSDEIFNVDFKIKNTSADIKYVDYCDFKNTENYKFAKNLTSKKLLQILCTSASLLAVLIICSIITMFSGRSPLYYFFFISGFLIAIFYPVLFAVNKNKFRIKYQNQAYDFNLKKHLYIGLSLVLFVLIICIIVNICKNNNSIYMIIRLKTFANIYAPLLISSTVFLDVLYSRIFLSKLKK